MVVFLQVDMRIRWVGPIIPPLVILSAHGLHNILAKAINIDKKPARQWAVVGIGIVVIAGFGLNAAYLKGLFQKVDAVSCLTGKISRTEFIQQRRPEYAAIDFINQNLPSDMQVLAIYLGKRRYYFDRDVHFVNQLHWTTRLNASTEVAEGLRQAGFTHIIVRYDLFNTAMQNQLTADQAGRLVKFFNEHATLLFRRDGYGVYKIYGHRSSLRWAPKFNCRAVQFGHGLDYYADRLHDLGSQNGATAHESALDRPGRRGL